MLGKHVPEQQRCKDITYLNNNKVQGKHHVHNVSLGHAFNSLVSDYNTQRIYTEYSISANVGNIKRVVHCTRTSRASILAVVNINRSKTNMNYTS